MLFFFWVFGTSFPAWRYGVVSILAVFHVLPGCLLRLLPESMQDVALGGAFDNVEDAECAVAGAVSDLPHALADVGHGLPVARIRALLHKSQIRTGFHA